MTEAGEVETTTVDLSFLDDLGGLAYWLPDVPDDDALRMEEDSHPSFLKQLWGKIWGFSYNPITGTSFTDESEPEYEIADTLKYQEENHPGLLEKLCWKIWGAPNPTTPTTEIPATEENEATDEIGRHPGLWEKLSRKIWGAPNPTPTTTETPVTEKPITEAPATDTTSTNKGPVTEEPTTEATTPEIPPDEPTGKN